MGLFSSSSRSSNTTNNDIDNYNLQGTNAQTVVAGNNNTVTNTDYGAIVGALDLASQSVGSNQLVSLAAMEQSADLAEVGMAYVGEAWKDSSTLAVDTAKNAANMIDEISRNNSDRVERMATAVATDGQNLIAENGLNFQTKMAENSRQFMYVIGGISCVAVLGMALLAKGAK